MEADSDPQSIETDDLDGSSTPDLVFETQYDYNGSSDSLTVVIIDAIAAELGISPTEVVPQISDAVDPDALERILRPRPDGSRRNGTLMFYLLDFRITVESDGRVRIHDDA